MILERGKILVIQGPQGSGKSQLASTIARANSRHIYWVEWDRFVRDPFWGDYDGIINNPGAVVIVGECARMGDEWTERVKALCTSGKMLLHRRGKDDVLVDTPHFVFILNEPLSDRSDVDRRIKTLTIGGAG